MGLPVLLPFSDPLEEKRDRDSETQQPDGSGNLLGPQSASAWSPVQMRVTWSQSRGVSFKQCEDIQGKC
jgi:hypothetical protein